MGAAWLFFLLALGGMATAGHEEESCQSCHATGQKAESRLCDDCHRDITRRATVFMHGSLQGNCLACHQLHEPGGTSYLRMPEIELCGSCHPATLESRSHPLGATVAADGRTLTCSSHCHDVHGAEHAFLCRLPPGRELCVSCHGEKNIP